MGYSQTSKSKRTVSLIAVIAAIAAAGVSAPLAASATTAPMSWSTPVTHDGGNSSTPELATNSEGRVVAAWNGSFGDGPYDNGIYVSTSLDGQTWDTQIMSSATSEPELIIGPDDTFYLTWATWSLDTTIGTVNLATSIDGITWDTSELVSDTENAYRSHVAVAPNGDVQVMWSSVSYDPDNEDAPVTALMAMDWDGSTWSSPEELTRSEGILGWDIQLIARPDNGFVVAFSSLNVPIEHSAVFVAVLVPDASWVVIGVTTDPFTQVAWSPKLAVNADNLVVLTWMMYDSNEVNGGPQGTTVLPDGSLTEVVDLAEHLYSFAPFDTLTVSDDGTFAATFAISADDVKRSVNVVTSTDGVNWSEPVLISTPDYDTLPGNIAWNGSEFMTIWWEQSPDGSIDHLVSSTSPDGVTWTAPTAASANRPDNFDYGYWLAPNLATVSGNWIAGWQFNASERDDVNANRVAQTSVYAASTPAPAPAPASLAATGVEPVATAALAAGLLALAFGTRVIRRRRS